MTNPLFFRPGKPSPEGIAEFSRDEPSSWEIAMALGTVTWFSVEKGLGLIAPMDGSTDVMVHAAAVARAGLHALVEGQRVRYEAMTDGKRQIAEHLFLV